MGKKEKGLSLLLRQQLVATCIIQVIRRRFFHPMSAVPGPWLNSITEFPAFINLVTGNQHTYYRSIHEKYGPVVRVSPNELSFVSLEAREEIYGLRVRFVWSFFLRDFFWLGLFV